MSLSFHDLVCRVHCSTERERERPTDHGGFDLGAIHRSACTPQDLDSEFIFSERALEIRFRDPSRLSLCVDLALERLNFSAQ
tara:strand:- start:4785 stop:5030 length:246 start_codon:yes stop_codon:yes gene_type:complete